MYKGQKVRIGPMEMVPDYPRNPIEQDPTSYVGMEAEIIEILPGGRALLCVPEKLDSGKPPVDSAPLAQLIPLESRKSPWELKAK